MKLPDNTIKTMIDDLSIFFSYEWDNFVYFDKSIYNNKEEYIEVKIREIIHALAVEKGLMK